MDENAQNKDRKFKVMSSRDAKMKQNQSMYDILSTDTEYSALDDYIDVDNDALKQLTKELQAAPELSEKAPLVSTSNIFRILQYDIRGYSTHLIGRQLNLTVEQVRFIKSSESYLAVKQSLLTSVLDSSRKYMEVATIKAVKTLVQCMDSPNERVRLMAAQDLLTRTGLSAPQKIEVTTQDASYQDLSDEDLMEILKDKRVIPKNSEVVDVGSPE